MKCRAMKKQGCARFATKIRKINDISSDFYKKIWVRLDFL